MTHGTHGPQWIADENEAPERIWAYTTNGDMGAWAAIIGQTKTNRMTEYIHADLFNAQAARIAELEVAIKRQAGAAKTLRNSTLAEVQHIKDNERKEYLAIKTLDSEREANAILTGENEALQARIAELEAEIVRMKSERMYVIGFNDGYDKAENLATLAELKDSD